MLDNLLQEWETLTADLVWQPHPGNRPQVQAYFSDAFETLYGGAAGGGKSDLLLGLARTMHRRSLLMRRTFPDLERSLISRSLEFFGNTKAYNSQKHLWQIDGRRTEFGHMERIGTPQVPGDEAQYASAPYDLVGFDQLEQFAEYGYTFMLSRVRSADGHQARVVATANPVGNGIEWIMRRWRAWLIDKIAKPGELRWYYRLEGDEQEREAPNGDKIWDEKGQDWVTPKSRTFIPAGLQDNPYLGDDYKAALQLLPEPLRSALLKGLWSAMLTDDAYQVIPRAWVQAAMDRWMADGKPENTAPVIGVDVARGGEDQTVRAKRYNFWVAPLEKTSGRSTPDGQSVAGLIAIDLSGGGVANVDVIGVGASAFDISCMQGLAVVGCNFSSASHARDRSQMLNFVNLRAELYWKFREWLDPANAIQGQEPQLPPDPELLGDLIAPRWQMMTNGVKIESKEDIKHRLGRSPDCGDAAVMALWQGLLPEQLIDSI
jgi:hypothetical protein